ncbi:MAG: hypothetical protein M1834_000893 [Cirrosporium novae-zelandiae]|nr:MAG: hypothetical protein M1834_000893 [Cirrosporium novae-zelandiae]
MAVSPKTQKPQTPTNDQPPPLPKGSTLPQNRLDPPYTSHVEIPRAEPGAPWPPLDSKDRNQLFSSSLPWLKTVHSPSTHNPLTSKEYTASELQGQAQVTEAIRGKYVKEHSKHKDKKKDKEVRRAALVKKRDEIARRIAEELERVNKERNEMDKKISEMNLQHELEKKVWLKQREAREERERERERKRRRTTRKEDET